MQNLVLWRERYPFNVDRETSKIIRDAISRLMTPERHAWWFNMGKADGVRGYGCHGPNGFSAERRMYRLGWIVGRKRKEAGK